MDNDEHNLSDLIEIITPELNGGPATVPAPTSAQPSSTPSRHHSHTATSRSPKPYIRIIVQPTKDVVRFRYESEGRSAGSIPGEDFLKDNPMYPTIEIVGYSGEVSVVVSCVTKDEPYRAHPHKLVGKDCKDGICTKKTRASQPIRFEFGNMGIQCARRKDVVDSLNDRERRQIDPFMAGFDHKRTPKSIDLNLLRLCFQAFIRTPNGWDPLRPVVSDVLYDKKGYIGLKINRLCSCSATVDGGDEIILLCEKVVAANIKVRFKALVNEREVWHAYADFEPTHVHKQTAIVFRTPRFPKSEYPENVETFIELERPSDGLTSKALEFEFHYSPGMLTFARLRRKLKRKQDLDVFQQILSLDSETTATKYSCPPTDWDGELEDNETVSTESSVSKPQSLDTLNEYESGGAKRQTESMTDDGNDDVQHADGMDIELEVPQINYPAADESTQTSTPMEEILKHPQLAEPRQLSAVDKITEWMRSSEFERTDSLTVENGDSLSLSPVTVCTNITSISANNHTTISTATDEDKTFTDLMEQAAELDDILTESQSRRGTLDNPIIKELSMGDDSASVVDVVANVPAACVSVQPSVEVDESFDETATYTSLKIAFKNPIHMPVGEAHRLLTEKHSSVFVNEEDGLVVLKNPPAPKIRVNSAQTPPSPPSPPLPLPPRTPSPVPEQKLPPLPPKRKSSQEYGSSEATPRGSVELSRNSSISSRPPSQIIIMRTPDQSPTKRQSTPTASPKKRQGFFSRLFSRHKNKPELAADENVSKLTGSKATSPNGSREPSIGHFSLSDAKRSSLRSIKSLQPNSPGLSPQNNASSAKGGKPVGRSVSSVSGKRPAHLNADVIHIPLKGESAKSLPQQEGRAFTFDILKRKRRKMNAQTLVQLAKYGQLANISNPMYPTTSKQTALSLLPSFLATDVKNEPACVPAAISPDYAMLSPPLQQQQPFTTYRSDYPLSPPSQPLSPVNRNGTPSPAARRASNGQPDQQYSMLNGSASSPNCRLDTVDAMYTYANCGSQENQFQGDLIGIQPTEFVVNHMSIAPTMSGGSISPLTNTFTQLQTASVLQSPAAFGQQHNQLSDSAAIEQIMLNLMQSHQINDNTANNIVQ